ncbi:MAG: KTSC domain-containing protein [Opitutales bacterium]|nr:KTSC domain-containing protein [Opitutales bacterium]
MERRRVISTLLSSVGYDAAAKHLEVELVNGSVFEYYGVPEDIHRALMNADSRGSFYHGMIEHVYAFRKLR